MRWCFDGTFVDPADRYFCFIIDAVVGAVVAETAVDVAVPAAIGAAEIGGTAAITLPEVVATAAAPELIGAGVGAGEIGAGVGAGVGAGAGVAGALDVGGGVGAGGGAPTTPGVDFGTGGLLDTLQAPGVGTGTAPAIPGATAPATPGINVAPLSNMTAPASATSVGGPAAAAPAAPASAPLSPTATGDFGFWPGEGTTPTVSDFGNPGLSGGPTDAGGGAAGGKSGVFGGLDKTLTDATGVSLKDIGTVGSIGGLGMNLLNANKKLPGQQQVSQAAGSLNATAAAQANEARTLMDYVNTGTLPPGLSQGFRTATDAAKASIKAQHASRGTSGSSAEMQDLQAAEDRSTAASADMAVKLLQQGGTLSGMAVNTESLSAQLYTQIMNDALARDKELGSSIGNFSAALAGGGTAVQKAA